MSLDPRDFRSTLGLFASGVTVVATAVGSQLRAMTANAFSSVSLDPPLVLFCPAMKSKLAASLPDMEGFSINFLRQDQQALASYFAGGWRDTALPPFRFVATRWAPRLEGSLASLICQTERLVEGGDHWVVLGRAVALHRGIEPHRPLVFFRGQFREIDEREGLPAPDLSVVEEEPPHIYYEHR